MPLILMVETTNPALRAYAGKRVAVEQSLTVGRGNSNDLVLPDPGRVVSTSHLLLSFDGSGYTVTDLSTNGTFMNHGAERLPLKVPTPLHQDDYLQLGDYGLVVLEVAAAASGAGGDAYGGGAGTVGGAPAKEDLDDLFADMAPRATPGRSPPPAGPDPFDAFFEDKPPVSPSSLPQSPYGSPINPGGPLDLGYGPGAKGGDELFGGLPGNAGDLSPLQGGGRMLIPEDDDLFGPPPVRNNWQGGSRADHTPSEEGFFAPPKVSTESIPDDWDPAADLGLPAAPRPYQPPPARPPQSQSPPPSQPVLAPEMPPVAAQPARPAATAFETPPAQPAIAVAAASGGDAAMAAFLRDAGLAGMPLSEAQAVKMMAMLGRTMRLLVEGMTEILAARASTKQEFRIERTMIGKLDNNPLKFSATTDEAMRVLMLQNVPGFLSAEQAFGQALLDIKSHQLAVMAGMQKALTTLVARFDPTQLEKRIEKSSVFDGVLPGARKARYWDLFRKLYGEIARELEDDLQSLFGSEFAAAYRAQVEQLEAVSERGEGGEGADPILRE